MTGASIWVSQTATRAQRRRLVCLMYSLFLVTFAGIASGSKPLALLAGMPGAISMIAFFAIMKFTHSYRLRNSPYEAPRPDEREARVRDFAMARSYLVLAVMVIVCSGFFAVVADEPAWWHSHHRMVSALCLGVNFLVLSMPEAIIAWNEPDVLT